MSLIATAASAGGGILGNIQDIGSSVEGAVNDIGNALGIGTDPQANNTKAVGDFCDRVPKDIIPPIAILYKKKPQKIREVESVIQRNRGGHGETQMLNEALAGVSDPEKLAASHVWFAFGGSDCNVGASDQPIQDKLRQLEGEGRELARRLKREKEQEGSSSEPTTPGDSSTRSSAGGGDGSLFFFAVVGGIILYVANM